ncbi:FAD assembly factor SdhE [Candidatus Nitrotoga sp. M5]|uniref:FAD assembly factor SdhE n=1 Tax=Candidatus Nitrotoga sp. M5 TaxID=2890409 RepID=UPI001EF2CCAB|nr:succinate dehydrogenase assembly factor 2 [Candidatus Nitrotoga sp. M5]CAH1386723.1 FAD assembly factor SdhE [Candidatus Nitrotoga sp. M5]
MKEVERVRWRCRRGLLELDIVLGRFVEQHYASLNKAQQDALDVLLDMPDPTLWDMITNTQPSPLQSEQCVVLKLMQTV